MLPFFLPPLLSQPRPPPTQQHNMELHWDKHHRAYVTNLNAQIKDTELDAADKTIEEVVKATWNGGKPTPAFNNAAQVWNHSFFWHSMKETKSELVWRESVWERERQRESGKRGDRGKLKTSKNKNKTASPSGALAAALDRDFGSLDAFKKEFSTAGATQFGSGWAWLVLEKATGKLLVRKTGNAETPLTDESVVPILTMDGTRMSFLLFFGGTFSRSFLCPL